MINRHANEFIHTEGIVVIFIFLQVDRTLVNDRIGITIRRHPRTRVVDGNYACFVVGSRGFG